MLVRARDEMLDVGDVQEVPAIPVIPRQRSPDDFADSRAAEVVLVVALLPAVPDDDPPRSVLQIGSAVLPRIGDNPVVLTVLGNQRLPIGWEVHYSVTA